MSKATRKRSGTRKSRLGEGCLPKSQIPKLLEKNKLISFKTDGFQLRLIFEKERGDKTIINPSENGKSYIDITNDPGKVNVMSCVITLPDWKPPSPRERKKEKKEEEEEEKKEEKEEEKKKKRRRKKKKRRRKRRREEEEEEEEDSKKKEKRNESDRENDSMDTYVLTHGKLRAMTSFESIGRNIGAKEKWKSCKRKRASKRKRKKRKKEIKEAKKEERKKKKGGGGEEREGK